MKKIYLVRHGKSSWTDPLLTDFERPLNERGKANATAFADTLKSHKIIPELIYSSPANRALSTARIVASGIGYPLGNIKVREEIYDAGTEDLRKVIKDTPREINSIMLFGHNPGFIMLAQELLEKEIEFFPTCTICGIEINTNDWKQIPNSGNTCFIFQSPKKDLL